MLRRRPNGLGAAIRVARNLPVAYRAARRGYDLVRQGVQAVRQRRQLQIAAARLRPAAGVAARNTFKSTSAGFLKPKKISKRQKKVGKFQSKGVLYTTETGIATNSTITDSLYIGHITFLQTVIRVHLYRVLVKYLFERMSISVKNFNDVAEMNVGDVITLFYKNNQEDATAEAFVQYVFAAAGTYENIVTNFETLIGAANPEFIFTSMKYQCSGGNPISAKINLLYATIKIDAKSSLKIQNITRGSLGAEADNVDNVPLYGRSYYGKGTGCITNRNALTEVTMIGNDATGIIWKVGAVAAGTSEMPPPAYFLGVKGSGKARLEPGHIKTSVLDQSSTYTLPKLCRLIFDGVAADVKNLLPAGKFAFFGLEHLIKSTATDPKLDLKGELNYRLGMSMKMRRFNKTDEKVAQTYVVLA